MDDLSHMTLSKFKLWSIHALKVYLSCRNRSVNGEFEELAARAFCVWEENVTVDTNAELAEKRLLQEYKDKLLCDGDTVPDPFALSSGWKGERAGLCSWPSIYITDISEYLGCSTPNEVMNKLLNEYKIGKAYRYFESEWVKEVHIHNVRENSNKCLLKTKVTPSQSINNKSYDVWAIVSKDTEHGPGGKIISAYCTCTAGMLGSCNHVAGLLFRVEHAVKTGETKKSTTSKLSVWNVPKGKPIIKPQKATDVIWSKGRYDKSVKNEDEQRHKKEMKSNFTPLSKAQKEKVKDESQIRNDLYQLLKSDMKNSCFALCYESRRIEAPKANIPDSLLKIANDMVRGGSSSEEELLDKLRMTNEQRVSLQLATTEQSSSSIWKEQRKGRVTASVFQRVSSRVDTLRKNENADPTALVETILGRKESRPTVAMKHGISVEPHAKKEYIQIMRRKHKKFQSCDSGLTVFLEKPFIAASADLEIDCECCGKGLCEIKCPESIKDQSPSSENVSYLKMENGQVKLDNRHPYYYQIQGQMKILNRQFCDLFVYTYHGNICVRLTFDKDFWDTLEEKLSWFWTVHVMPQLLNNTGKENIASVSDNNIASVTKQSSNPRAAETPTKLSTILTAVHSNARRILLPTKPSKEPTAQQQKKRRKTAKKVPVYLCGMCGCDCVDDPQSEADQSVSCDKCEIWVHYVCAGVTDKELETLDKWFCPKCS